LIPLPNIYIFCWETLLILKNNTKISVKCHTRKGDQESDTYYLKGLNIALSLNFANLVNFQSDPSKFRMTEGKTLGFHVMSRKTQNFGFFCLKVVTKHSLFQLNIVKACLTKFNFGQNMK